MDIIARKLADAISSSAYQQADASQKEAPVLLLLSGEEESLSFFLTKRSQSIPQGGDLSCAGGMLNLPLDRMINWLIACNVFQLYRQKTSPQIKRQRFGIHLATAVREAWEEVGLSPFNISLLGILPPHDLILFNKRIIPFVAHIKKPWVSRLSGEVEKVVEVPLSMFCDANNYVCYRIEHPSSSRDFPALAIKTADGQEEILWGATFFIAINFLRVCFNFELPDWESQRIVKRQLTEEYITGNSGK